MVKKLKKSSKADGALARAAVDGAARARDAAKVFMLRWLREDPRVRAGVAATFVLQLDGQVTTHKRCADRLQALRLGRRESIERGRVELLGALSEFMVALARAADVEVAEGS